MQFCGIIYFPKQCLHYGVLAEHKGLVGVRRLPAQRETRKTHNFLREYWLFQKKRSWRSSFEVPRFIFLWMLRLILLFLLKKWLWVTRSLKGYQGGIWAPWLVVCNHQPAGWLFANHQPEICPHIWTNWSPNPTLVAFRGPGHPKAIFNQKQQN